MNHRRPDAIQIQLSRHQRAVDGIDWITYDDLQTSVATEVREHRFPGALLPELRPLDLGHIEMLARHPLTKHSLIGIADGPAPAKLINSQARAMSGLRSRGQHQDCSGVWAGLVPRSSLWVSNVLRRMAILRTAVLRACSWPTMMTIFLARVIAV